LQKYIYFPIALYGCETWSLILFAERRKRVFDSRMMRKIMGVRRMRWQNTGRNCRVRNCLHCPPRAFWWSNKEEWEKRSLYHIWWKRALHKGPWEGGVEGKRPFRTYGVYGRITLKWVLKN